MVQPHDSWPYQGDPTVVTSQPAKPPHPPDKAVEENHPRSCKGCPHLIAALEVVPEAKKPPNGYHTPAKCTHPALQMEQSTPQPEVSKRTECPSAHERRGPAVELVANRLAHGGCHSRHAANDSAACVLETTGLPSTKGGKPRRVGGRLDPQGGRSAEPPNSPRE